MPLQRCQSGGASGWKCGDSGKCYTGTGAKQEAINQCIAEGEADKLSMSGLHVRLNKARARAETHLPALQRAASSVLLEAGESAASRFEAMATEHLVAAGWTPPETDEVLSLDELMQKYRGKSDPIRLSAIMAYGGVMEGLSWEVGNPLVGGLIEKIGQHVTSIAETTRQELSAVMNRSYEEGLSIKDTAKAIRSYMGDASQTRGEMIARTEMNRLVNGASVAATQLVGEGTGTTYFKRWLTAPGAEHPRHEEYDGLDGQTTTLDGSFEVGDDRLEYPSDPNGSPEETINCRCTLEYTDDASALTAAAPDFSGQAMVALYPREQEANQLAQDGGQPPDTLHVTMVYLGAANTVNQGILERVVGGVAAKTSPLAGEVGGVGVFEPGPDGTPSIVTPDVPDLAALRELLVAELLLVAIEDASEHGFTPHMTISYGDGDPPPDNLIGTPLHFDQVSVIYGQNRIDFDLERPAWEEPAGATVVESLGMATQEKRRRRLAKRKQKALVAGATGSTSLPLTDRNVPWDAGVAQKSLDSGQFGDAHFWKDPKGPADQIGSYKLPFAKSVDGKLTAVWRGVTAGAARLSQTDIPASDKSAVQGKMAQYYSKAAKQFDDPSIKTPWSVEVEEMAVAESDEVVNSTVEEETAEVLADVPTNASALRWTATLLTEGVPTDDGRMIEPGATSWRELPLSLMAQVETHEGHDGAAVAGRIDQIFRDGNDIKASGVFDESDFGREVARMVDEGMLRGVSVDLAVREYELRATGPTGEEPDLLEQLLGDSEALKVFTDCVIGAVTVLPFPAFADASIAMAADASNKFTATKQHGMVIVEAPAETSVLLVSETLTASAAGLVPENPPLLWFDDPELPEPTPLTVTDEGRVFGHAAVWDICHMGFQNECVLAPRSSSDYGYFHLGEVVAVDDEGDDVALPVGKITLGTGHADLRLNQNAAVEHYDDTGTVVADVRVGEDTHGVWFAGALRPSAVADRVREFRAAAISGDWRAVKDKGLELVALLAVNVPGFPVPRTQARVAAGEVPVGLAVTAAGVADRDTVSALLAEREREEEAERQLTTLAARAAGNMDELAERAGVEARPFRDEALEASLLALETQGARMEKLTNGALEALINLSKKPDVKMPDLHMHLPTHELALDVHSPDTHIEVQPSPAPDVKVENKIETPPALVEVNVEQPRPRSVRVVEEEDGTKRYVPEEAA